MASPSLNLDHYRPLVRRIARVFAARTGEDVDDLEGEGLVGLCRAARDWRPGRGTKFQTYAEYHVRGAMRHYLRDRRAPVRLPGYRWERGERPMEVLSLEALEDEGDAGPITGDFADAVCERIALDERLAHLTPKRQTMLRLMLAGLNQSEAAHVLGITQNGACRRYHTALAQLATLF